MAANIDLAYKWAIDTCNAPNVGYSQSYRNEKTVNGITYYDCSSFIWYALLAGDFPILDAYQKTMGFAYSGNAIVTAYERAWLTNMGFEKVDIRGEWKPGDILWRSGHTEMVYNGSTGQGRSMGAHTSNAALSNQVSINTNITTYAKWTELYHWPEGGGAVVETDWIKGNYALTLAQMRQNANNVKAYLEPRGWSINAIAALLGNMQTESWINPGVWQGFQENPELGYGLVQWTPSSKITDWLTENGYALDDGDAQLKWIDEETVPQGQWNPHGDYNQSFDWFKSSTASVEYLAYMFMYDFEQPGNLDQPDRQTQARYWFNYLNGENPTPDVPTPPTPGVVASNRKMPLWMMLRYH